MYSTIPGHSSKDLVDFITIADSLRSFTLILRFLPITEQTLSLERASENKKELFSTYCTLPFSICVIKLSPASPTSNFNYHIHTLLKRMHPVLSSHPASTFRYIYIHTHKVPYQLYSRNSYDKHTFKKQSITAFLKIPAGDIFNRDVSVSPSAARIRVQLFPWYNYALQAWVGHKLTHCTTVSHNYNSDPWS